MRKILCIFSCAFLALSVSYSQSIDLSWPFGYNEYDGLVGFGQAVLHFRENGTIEVEEQNLDMNFEATAAFATDSLGNFLFYSNGCEIFTGSGNLITDGLNPGLIYDRVCPDKGYIVPKGAMALPWPDDENRYIILHLGLKYSTDKELRNGPFYYTGIHVKTESVFDKNTILESGFIESFAVTRHGNGRDWWIIGPELNTNKYHTWLFSPNGIEKIGIQSQGSAFSCSRPGSSTFSLKGNMYGRQHNCKVAVFDFDRCSGSLLFLKSFDRSNHFFGGGGIAFSPDESRLLVSGDQVLILEADMTNPQTVLDTAFNWKYNSWGTAVGMMQYGPNEKIYLNSMARRKYYAGINNPNGIGDDMEFDHEAVTLPVISVRTLPNLPNYRLFDKPNSPCDTLGINGTSAIEKINPKETLDFSPNPAHNFIQITNTAYQNLFFKITDLDGKIRIDGNVQNKESIDVSFLANGIYFVQFFDNQFMIISRKLIVLH